MFKGSVPLIAAAFVVAAVFGSAPAPAEAQGPVRAVAQALLDFEAGMKWEAVQDSWRGQRDPWMAGLRAARSPQQVASALGVLEVAMKWEAVDGSWRARRPSWVAEVAAASSPAQVAQLLLDLEQATTWAAMFDTWRGTRPGWVAGLQAIAGRGAPAPAARQYAVGQAVEVLWNGTWYAATILSANPDGTYRIHYTGWGSEWDENVGPDRMR